jgi:hypothetical protein
MCMEHIKNLRLFHLSQVESRKSDFRLEDWEKKHLQECEECHRTVELFTRQFSAHRPLRDKPDDAA